MGNGTRDNCAKLLLLDLFAANVYLQSQVKLSKLIRPLPEANIILNLFWTSSRGVVGALDEYEDNPTLHEESLDVLQTLTDAIDFVSGCLVARSQEEAVPSSSTFDRDQISMLQKICHQRLRSVQRSMDKLNRAHETRDKAHNIRESVSVKRLTILATIFLPLLLSTSILNMRSRFVDLKLKLYDFVGVCTIVGTAAGFEEMYTSSRARAVWRLPKLDLGMCA